MIVPRHLARASSAGALTLALAALAFGQVACSGCRGESQPDAQRVAVEASPVAAPDGLLLEAAARGPDALWGRLQKGIGGPLEQLPQTIGGVLTTVARLDPAVASEVDGAAPAFAVVAGTGADAKPAWIVALGLRDHARARAALTAAKGGKPARFTSVEGEGGVVLLGSGDAASPTFTLGLSPLGYLLLASSAADLTALAPYATRTLPARPKSAHGVTATVTHAALAGVVHERLARSARELRETATRLDASLRAEHGGKAPDLGDPTVIIQALSALADEELAVLADLAHADVTLDASETDVDVELTVTPGRGPSAKAFSSLTAGDAAPMLTLSAETDVAILLRDDSASLHAWATRLETQAAAALKPALSEKDRKVLSSALTGWADARGPWLTAAVEVEGSPAVTLRTPAPDPARATKAFGALVDLTQLPVFRTMLQSRLGATRGSTATVSASGSGATSLATFSLGDAAHPRKGADAPTEVALAWAATGELLQAAAATSSARALRASRDPVALLGRDMELATKLGTLRDRSAVVVAVRRAVGAESAAGSATKGAVVLGLGHEGDRGWGMAEVDDVLLGDVVQTYLSR